MWRDLTDDERHRPPELRVEITDVKTMGIEGNPADEGFYTWGIVKVETDAGEYGIGETYRGTEALSLAEQMGPLVVGETPLDPARIAELLSGEYTGSGTVGQSAITAIETACWDLKGKVHDLPVYELLGGKFRDRVQVYSDTDALARTADAEEEYSPEAVAQAARDVVDQGFRSIKFDLDVPTPGHPNPDTAARRLDPAEIDHKVEMVRAAREAVGDDVDLGMDLHWKFSVETAVRLGRALEEFDLAFLEDPVHPEKLDAQRRVKRQVDIPILNGENVVTANRFYDLLRNDTLDIAAPDMARCGGLSEFRTIAALCDVHGVVVAPHNLTSPVGTLASVHACASVPNVYSVEYRGGDAPWWDDVVTLTDGSDLRLEDGYIAVPNGPGLGVEIDPDGVRGRLVEGSEYIF
jgi:L-alanine-DL-glutamate epimerase-like enolase superfamily enzyme